MAWAIENVRVKEKPVIMKVLIQLRCCVCDDLVARDDPDGYSIEVQKFGARSSEMIWAHGACLREAIPFVAEGLFRF